MEENKRTLEESTRLNDLAKKLGVSVKDIRPLNKGQLAEKYQVDYRTINKWLKPFKEFIKNDESYIYSPDQVIKIYEKLGPLPLPKKNH